MSGALVEVDRDAQAEEYKKVEYVLKLSVSRTNVNISRMATMPKVPGGNMRAKVGLRLQLLGRS